MDFFMFPSPKSIKEAKKDDMFEVGESIKQLGLEPDGRDIKTVLVCDGGGLRGYMSVQILKELELQVQKQSDDMNLQLWQLFDLYVGTSTGGLISIGLGQKGMSCEEIELLYEDCARKVFCKDANMLQRGLNKVYSALSMAGITTSLDTDTLEEFCKSKLTSNEVFRKNTKLTLKNNNMDTGNCCVISTLSSNVNMPSPVLLRNYDPIGVNPNLQWVECTQQCEWNMPGVSRCVKTWEAARATSAAPGYFLPYHLPMPATLAKRIIQQKFCQTTGVGFDFEHNKLSFKGNFLQKRQVSMFVDQIYDLLFDKKTHLQKDILPTEVTKLVKEIKSTFSQYYSDIDVIKGNFHSFTEEEFINNVLHFRYTIELCDGGLNSNSPLLASYVEASRLYKNSRIVMLSVGTGRPYEIDRYDHNKGKNIWAANQFNTLFGAKELATITPIMSLANIDMFDLQRMNPEFDINKSEMSNPDLMDYWKKIGIDYAKMNSESIKNWAKFLVEKYKARLGIEQQSPKKYSNL